MSTCRKWTEPLVCKITDGFVEINGVKGYLMYGDIEILTHFALQMPPNARIAEIGSFLGLSGLLMAKALYGSGKYGARIYCIDTWEGSDEHQSMEIIRNGTFFELFKSNITESGLLNYFTPIRQNSIIAARDFPDQSMDMIFIDGDHSFSGCLADLRAWYPKLKPGGVFLGHDGELEVRRAIDSFLGERDLACILLGVPPYSNYMYRLVERSVALS